MATQLALPGAFNAAMSSGVIRSGATTGTRVWKRSTLTCGIAAIAATRRVGQVLSCDRGGGAAGIDKLDHLGGDRDGVAGGDRFEAGQLLGRSEAGRSQTLGTAKSAPRSTWIGERASFEARASRGHLRMR